MNFLLPLGVKSADLKHIIHLDLRRRKNVEGNHLYHQKSMSFIEEFLSFLEVKQLDFSQPRAVWLHKASGGM